MTVLWGVCARQHGLPCPCHSIKCSLETIVTTYRRFLFVGMRRFGWEYWRLIVVMRVRCGMKARMGVTPTLSKGKAGQQKSNEKQTRRKHSDKMPGQSLPPARESDKNSPVFCCPTERRNTHLLLHHSAVRTRLHHAISFSTKKLLRLRKIHQPTSEGLWRCRAVVMHSLMAFFLTRRCKTDFTGR